jgi:hypothetical protein
MFAASCQNVRSRIARINRKKKFCANDRIPAYNKKAVPVRPLIKLKYINQLEHGIHRHGPSQQQHPHSAFSKHTQN